MRKPEAIIFDMDGVLIDSESIHYKIEKQLFNQLGLSVPDEMHKRYLGVAGDFMYADLKSTFKLSASISELLEFDDTFRCDYFKRLPGLHLNKGVLPFLNQIRSAGIKMAVATSSSPALALILLERCEIISCFDVIVTTAESGKSKPAPDVYLLAAHKIGVSPENCMVFEDSPNGICAAKSAGMYCIAVESENVDLNELSKADSIIQTFSDITAEKIFGIFSLIHLV